MKYVSLYLDLKGFPCGQQRVLVTKEGAKWIYLFSPFTLDTGRLAAEQWPRTKAQDIIDASFSKLAKIAWKRFNMNVVQGSHRNKILKLIQELESCRSG